MKFAATIILYYPTDNVIQNILSYSKYCSKLYIFDNTPANTGFQSKAAEIAGATFFNDGENRGISERLNAGCKMAMKDGYQWVLTMDQDTMFEPDTIANYLACFNSYEPKGEVAAFCTRYGRNAEMPDAVCNTGPTDNVITSGMLVNLHYWEKLGGFDEALFIDSVDFEYCNKAEMAGLKIVCFFNIYIIHEVGELVYRSSIKSLFLVRKHKVIHSPLRCYYIYRNMLYLENKYRETNPAFAKKVRQIVETHIKTCLLYGRETKAINRYLKIATADYQNHCMGRIADEKII